MSATRLTIAIPTYNRAEFLDAQIAWFVDAVRGHEEACELLVSDNCSTDATPTVIEAWRERLRDTPIRVRTRRNPRNVGAIRNIAGCIEDADGSFVWVVGDDDRIDPTAITRVLCAIRSHADLSLLVLNFSSRTDAGRWKFERCFDIEHDLVTRHGQTAFERFLAHPDPSRWGGLALTTALVYRAQTARAALRAWPDGVGNLLYQLFVTAWCAQHGTMVVTADPLLVMRAGVHFFTEDRVLYLRFRIGDIPEGFVRIERLGVSRKLCRERALAVRSEISWRQWAYQLAYHPLPTVHALARYAAAAVHLGLPGAGGAELGEEHPAF